jgi:hypothetical protein
MRFLLGVNKVNGYEYGRKLLEGNPAFAGG